MRLLRWWQIINKGFTLLELMIVIVMLAILMASSAFIMRAILLSWSAQEARVGVNINLDRGIEETIRDVRGAKAVQSANDEVRFTLDNGNYSIYYLFNASDTYPSLFNQNYYQLRKAALTGGINGTFSYGDGNIIITDILPPPTSDISLSSNVTTIDLSVRRGNETIRSRTQVKSRNL